MVISFIQKLLTWIAMFCLPLSYLGDKRTQDFILMLPFINIDRAKSVPDDEEVIVFTKCSQIMVHATRCTKIQDSLS